MKKILVINLLVTCALLISACSTKTNATATSAFTETPITTRTQQTDESPVAANITPIPTSNAPDCQVINILETDPSLPAVTDKDWTKGPEDAKTTILEYSDFQCPYCAMIAPVLAELQEKYPEDIRIVYRHFPLITIHDKAALSSQAAEAAGLQGKFWEMHDLLFEKRAEWSELSTDDFEKWLSKKATELKLDVDKFNKDLNSDDIKNIIDKAYTDAEQLGIGGTPTIFINGLYYDLQQGGTSEAILEYITLLDKLNELQKKQYKTCPAMTIDPQRQYTATIQTEKGNFSIQLYADKAPLTVNSFIFLARNGWYDGVTFHRVINNFVAQTGDPSGTGAGGPGYFIKDEIDASLKFDGEGVVGMAKAVDNMNGSQFFITYTSIENLDGRFTIFGKVISGMDVVKQITRRDPAQGGNLPEGDKILGITIEEK
jgi:cyclophilin family peptidyl-prolyl cis-trans isomerase/protein-disulfide isomerase